MRFVAARPARSVFGRASSCQLFLVAACVACFLLGERLGQLGSHLAELVADALSNGRQDGYRC